MRLAFLVAALLLASGAVVACDETAAPADDADGGGDGVADAADPSDEREPGVLYSPSGCPLTSTGFVSGRVATNVARPEVNGSVSWTDVEGALVEDGRFATVTLDEGEESAALRVSDFRLAIPDDKETWGIEVELKRRAPDGGIEDSRIELEIEGKTPRFKYMKGPWPTSIVGTHRYGQEIDTWNVDLYAADVNRSSFAAKVSIKRAADATGPVTASIESIRVAVHHCR